MTMKTANKTNISITTRATSTKTGLKEMERNKVFFPNLEKSRYKQSKDR